MLSTPIAGVHFEEARAFSHHSGVTGASDRVDHGECEQVRGEGERLRGRTYGYKVIIERVCKRREISSIRRTDR